MTRKYTKVGKSQEAEKMFDAESIIKAIESDETLITKLRERFNKHGVNSSIKLKQESRKNDSANGGNKLQCYIGENNQLIFDYREYTRYETTRRGNDYMAVDNKKYNSENGIWGHYNDFMHPLCESEMSLNDFVTKCGYQKLFINLETILRAKAQDNILGNIKASIYKALS